MCIGERIETHRENLTRYAKILCRNDTDANDLVQDTMLRGIQQQSKYKENSLSGWLKRIMYNLFVGNLRAKERRIRITTDRHTNKTDVERTTPLDIIIAKESNPGRDPRIQYGMKCLKPQYLEAVELYFHGFQMDQIAELLNIPVGTVFSRVARGKSVIKEKAPLYRKNKIRR